MQCDTIKCEGHCRIFRCNELSKCISFLNINLSIKSCANSVSTSLTKCEVCDNIPRAADTHWTSMSDQSSTLIQRLCFSFLLQRILFPTLQYGLYTYRATDAGFGPCQVIGIDREHGCIHKLQELSI